MKKLILSAAIVLGSLTTMSAQDQAPAEDKNTVPTEQAAPATEQATPAEATVAEEVNEYTEIKTEEVPAAVTEALKKAFPDAVLNKAAVNDKKEYQLQVKVGDKEGLLYADETGKWIEK
ncbi:hypothetical protein SAMN05443543_10295 [Flavobacterium flevense]|uniref:Beta-lactamase-inhibitor-like PepSY-like domain-containing protein n=1 Tax=Flavobacterium flevense TaxID=983 RepID=A0A4Y4AUQ2_9FLAO|nr:hypothetical protein [Flavobacterium flevense]GEC71941.1 hypothetical protein FFL01_14800 [Flavobacterium flevense]SHL46455.1 hypothetical protein SAMN05443543_10295 [Flavobacterium flevense]